MNALADRFNYLFRSTKGLVLVAIGLIALVTVIWGTLSGPMAEMGVKAVTVDVLGIDLDPSEREGRLVMLYHSIAMAVVAIEVYFITDSVPMKATQQTTINATVTLGYLISLVFGLGFAYFGHNRVFHGLFVAGLTLIYFAGVMLAVALWPWQKEYHVKDHTYAHWGKIDLERTAFFSLALATLGSALFGAIPGAYYGAEFETFLAEDVVRLPHKDSLELAVIGHLHIMLALLGVGITLILGRWFDFKGIFHKIAMPLMILGTIVITLGVWAVVPFEPIAHTIIYAGSVLVMLAALMLVIFGWDKLIRTHLREDNIQHATASQKIRALVRDPLRFGPLWQMVYMNFTVSGVGIFMAVKLDEIIRVWPHRDERITLTGHWHILSAIIATIILFYYADMVGLKGKLRQWFGWVIIIGSDLAFLSVTIFELKRLFINEEEQQSLVDTTMLLADIGLAAILVALALFLLWQLADLFKKQGRWSDTRTGFAHDNRYVTSNEQEGFYPAREVAK